MIARVYEFERPLVQVWAEWYGPRLAAELVGQTLKDDNGRTCEVVSATYFVGPTEPMLRLILREILVEQRVILGIGMSGREEP
jgi:hypothetical protein